MLAFCVAVESHAPVARSTQPEVRLPEAMSELLGDWYLLVHYTDAASESPERRLWQDRIWRIERSGSRIRWTIFPRVDLRDATGRRETLASGEGARSRGAWSPNEEQMAEIRAGLRMDPLGSRSKTLRLRPDGAGVSLGDLHSSRVSVLGYHERWAIVPSQSGPIFSREDSMGSGRTQAVRAATRFSTLSISPDGNQLRGEYLSDGDLRGEFRLIRMDAAWFRKGGS